jgi:hypothetical protein
MPSFTKPTDTANKIKLESHLIYALWKYKRAHAGQEAELEVKTSLVGNGATIKITCKNDSGKKFAKAEGVVFNNKFEGPILIPENVKPDDMLFFEAELPKHGLKGESNSIPARPAIKVTKLQWDRKEVKRKDIVTLTCQFQSGVEDDDEAVVLIYEHNPNSCDIKVVSIPATIKDNKVEMKWEFDYQDSTEQIATHVDLTPYEKTYRNPEFYFMVVVDGVRAGANKESGLMTFKDTFSLAVKDELGNPLANEQFRIDLADGSQMTGTLDSEGKATLPQIPAGAFEITFPQLTEITLAGKQAEK